MTPEYPGALRSGSVVLLGLHEGESVEHVAVPGAVGIAPDLCRAGNGERNALPSAPLASALIAGASCSSCCRRRDSERG